jgi:hypothetical protein
MPEYGFGRCDGHHEMVDLQKKRNASDCYYIPKIRQSFISCVWFERDGFHNTAESCDDVSSNQADRPRRQNAGSPHR